jgi:LPS-assembly protein
MRRILRVLFGAIALFGAASPAVAQQTVSGWTLAGDTQVQIGENHYVLTGRAEIEQGDTKLYADAVDFYPDEDRAVATGNVLFSQGNNRIGADSAEFNTRTRLGTFRHAYGIANIQPPRTATPGIVGAQLTNQQTDVYFFGDVVEKIGPKKYRISNGGFTTCVQPTPRWDLNADTVVLYVDHYTMLRDAILRVKGVPLLYLPFMYYPTKEDQRATGFLIPTYGVSSIRGQSIHDAFFWAIDRSQDLTIMHDWYSKAGQGVGGEYRYNWGGGSEGIFRGSFLNQTVDPLTSSLPNERSFAVTGGAKQMLPGQLRATASVNYFSSLATNQTFNTNVNDASRNVRQYGVNVVRGWNTYSLNATYDFRESFYSSTSTVSGSTPRVRLSRNERPVVAGSPVYFSVGSEYARITSAQKDMTTETDRGLTRLDVSPQLRYPFKQWPFFTVNSSFLWRDTYYTRSLDPVDQSIVDDNLNRQYFTLKAEAVGPVFNRVWDTPDNGYAERFKHSIEPVFTLERISSIDELLQARIVRNESGDYFVGGMTTFLYGLNNRFYAKRRTGQTGAALDILTVSLLQKYYTDPSASRVDPTFQTSSLTSEENNFSPLRLDVRARPTTDITGTVNVEFDSRYREPRMLTVNGTYAWTGRVQSTVGWTRKFLIPQLDGFNRPDQLNHYLNLSTNAQTRDNRFGGRYSLYYDILRSNLQEQRFSGFYNAQCCGLAVEYQIYDFGFTTDRRFFFSFSLAGLGNFSPLNGALGGIPR